MSGQSISDQLFREFVRDFRRHDGCIDRIKVPAGRQNVRCPDGIITLAWLDVFAPQSAQKCSSFIGETLFNLFSKFTGVTLAERRHRIGQQINFAVCPWFAERMEAEWQKGRLQFFEVVPESVDECITGLPEKRLAQT